MRALYSLFFVLFALNIHAQNADWQLKKSDYGIEVYNRERPEDKLTEFKGVIKLDESPEDVFELLKNIENIKTWAYRLAAVEILEEISPAEYFVRFELSIPWPMDNRDVVYHVRFSQNKADKSAFVVMECVNDYLEPKKGKVRISEAKTTYKITPDANGKTQVTFRQYADPADIPAWMLNIFNVDCPFVTLRNLRRELAED